MRLAFFVILCAGTICSGACGQTTSSVPDKLSGFTAGPYLLDVTTESAVVAFHLDAPSAAKVTVTDGNTIQEFKSDTANKSHFIKITGLKPGLTYDYQVICGDGRTATPEGDKSFQIKTACRPGESFTFAVYGDTRPSENKTTLHQREVINQTVLNEPLFCLVLGDLVDDGSRTDLWNEFFSVESKLLRRCAIYPVLGDTDFANGKGLYSDYFPMLEKGYYRFEWGGVQFFGLRAWGTRGGQERAEVDADSPQIKWLESELSKDEVQKAPFRVVFIHDPVYISRGRASEVLRRVWAPLFQKYKVDVVFASWHLYERSSNEEITYIVSGGAGAELIWMNNDPAYPSQADAREYHFCKVDINSNVMTISAIATNGTVLDSATLTARSHEPETVSRIERAAKRLEKEILIGANADNPPVPLYLFASDCEYCRQLIKYDLPKLASENNIALIVYYFDLGTEGVYDLFLNAEKEFGGHGTDIPAVFIGRSVFGGESQIRQNLPAEILKFRKDPQSYLAQMITPFTCSHDTATIKEDVFGKLTYGSVVKAGLLDGISPCAFTALIFFIVYLSLIGGTRRQMLYAGGIFTAAFFIACLVIGLAFFNSVKSILQGQTVATIINFGLLLVIAVMVIAAITELVRYLKFSPANIAPSEVWKEKIQARVRHVTKNSMLLTAASVLFGIIMAGMELACMGKVYLPIVTMISEPRYRIPAIGYLFSYNIAFVIPLVALFLLVIFGVTAEQIRSFLRQQVVFKQLGLILLFAVMAVIIIINLGWL